MVITNITEAKAGLSKLIEQVLQGEEVWDLGGAIGIGA